MIDTDDTEPGPEWDEPFYDDRDDYGLAYTAEEMARFGVIDEHSIEWDGRAIGPDELDYDELGAGDA